MSAEWTCEGCGAEVINVSIDKPPRHGFCAVCAWLVEHVADPGEMMKCRRFIEGDDKLEPKP